VAEVTRSAIWRIAVMALSSAALERAARSCGLRETSFRPARAGKSTSTVGCSDASPDPCPAPESAPSVVLMGSPPVVHRKNNRIRLKTDCPAILRRKQGPDRPSSATGIKPRSTDRYSVGC
jgi:hypothetical protein